MRVRRSIPVVLAIAATLLVGSNAALGATPRPGCGFGDPNHSHQAAPGQDPLGLRPGATESDRNHPHTFAPGTADIDAGPAADSPSRGC